MTGVILSQAANEAKSRDGVSYNTFRRLKESIQKDFEGVGKEIDYLEEEVSDLEKRVAKLESK